LQATSLGNAVLQVMFAFGILGSRLASGSAVADLQTPWAFDARELWPRGVVRPAMLSVYPNSAPRMPMTLRI
jgi:hypothetical protein